MSFSSANTSDIILLNETFSFSAVLVDYCFSLNKMFFFFLQKKNMKLVDGP